MNPLAWLRAEWARITNLPARLSAIIADAHRVMARASSSADAKSRAGRIWIDATQDRAEVNRLLRNHLRESTSLGGLGLGPLILVVGGVAAASVAATLVAIFGRASAYEQELQLIHEGAATAGDIERLRDGANTGGGVAATIREAGSFLKVAALTAAGVFAFKLWRSR